MLRTLVATGIAAFAFVFMLSMGAHGVAAENSVKIPSGAKAEIRGNSAIINNGGGGGSGFAPTFNCGCSGGAGSCSISISGNEVYCGQGPGGCRGHCELTVSKTGAKGMSQ